MLKKKVLQGLVKRHPDGFGFFIPDDREHPDVYIPKHSMKGIMTNDKVMINVMPESGGDRFRGDVVKIINRGTKLVVGRYFTISSHYGAIVDEAKAWGSDLKIKKEDNGGANEGDLVAVEITQYPGEGDAFAGRVKEVIGDAMDPLNDIRRVLLSQSIPHEFSMRTQQEAEQFTDEVEEKDFARREDLRDLNFITIDGATAKDFDDAVYVETDHTGFHLWVAIADVSHYVRPGTAIDEDAYERGTSVYFPNFVVPMLPEILSNGLCSLNPHIPRLALVAEMKMDFTGVMTETRFYEAVIESKARVTYGEAQEVIDGSTPEKIKHVEKDILRAADLAKVLMAKRFREGSLDLEIPETQLQLDASGNPVDIIRSERLFSHRLIEELMLAANIAVGRFLESRDIPGIYRIHEPPNPEAIQMLQKYIEVFGGKASMDGGKLQKKLTRALQDFAGRPEAQILNILTLRSMSQAKYSSNNVGHFGLGFEAYSHFTSPIRRYPDLIAHRLIKSQIMPNSGYRPLSQDDMDTSTTMLSACEQRAVKSERQFQAIKKARFMVQHVGQEFEGIISSVARFGVFVLLREFDIDGLVRSEDLSKERLEFDEETLRLVAPRSGMAFSIGDIVKIRVSDADPELGQINFEMMDHTSAHPEAAPVRRQGKGKKQEKHRGGRQQDKGQRREKTERTFGATKHQDKYAAKNKSQDKKHSKPVKDERPRFGKAPPPKKGGSQARQNPRFDNKKPYADSGKPVTEQKKHVDYVEDMLRKLKGSKGETVQHPDRQRDERNEVSFHRSPDRKNNQKRGKDEDHRRGVRKARPPQRRGKN